MRARDVIVIARRRAGLTQQELARRLTVPQGTIARWESGATEPKFCAVQDAVDACGLDLILGFANADEGSRASLIYDQLRRTPAERVRQLSHDDFDRVCALNTIGASGLQAIVVGEIAGALHGWPLMLDDHGGLELLVRSEDRELAEEVVAASLSPERIRLLEALPGTWGYGDLARNSEPMDVDGVELRAAALVDLLRGAHSENGRYSRRRALAFDETLRLTERLRHLPDSGHKPTEQEAREKADAWLASQTAA